MPNGNKPLGSLDPGELWKQWYDTSSKMWASALDGNKETFVDTYGLYRLWLETVGKAQEQVQANISGMMNTKEIWNAWFEATVGAWRRAAEMGGDPLGLTTQWLEMMEQTRKRIVAGDILPADPFTFFQKWYEATSETWAKVVDDTLSSEKFIESASPFLEIYSNFVKTLHRANEEYFSNLQLPTRSDLARVAGLVVAVDEKVDKLEDALENLEDEQSREAPLLKAANKAIGDLEGRLGQVENKLDTLSAALEKNEAAKSLDGRLGRVENKLDTLSTSLEKNEAAASVEGLTKRLDLVESKLDKVLAALQTIEASEHRGPETANSTETVQRRKTQKKTE
jgi:polyhydroxyalkanoic acid synthase PhaR subunit